MNYLPPGPPPAALTAEWALRMRPEAWEDDVCRHALEDRPFANQPPILDRVDQDPVNQKRLLPEALLDGRTLQSFAERDPWPIPSAADREGYAPHSDPQYWMSGLADFLKVSAILARYGIEVRSLLDFGCASGRFLRHFAAQTAVPELWGCDINHRHIRWLLEYLPARIKPLGNHCYPVLPLADHSQDLVTAFSVFTHIDVFETLWLAELRRVLRPGGLAYLTIHNEDTWEVLRGEVENPQNRLVQSLRGLDPDFPQRILEPLPSGRTVYRQTHQGPYRAQVFLSNDYIERVWGRFLDLREILPLHHVRQSVVILQKPGS